MLYPKSELDLGMKAQAVRSGNKTVRLLHWFLVPVVSLLMMGASTAMLAGPPAKSDCNIFDDVYERLECRQAALADQLAYTTDTVFAEDAEMHKHIKPNRLANIKNAKKKADRAVEKNTMKTFKQLAKSESRGHRSQELGYLVPLGIEDDVDLDGVCDYEQGNPDAKCAAVELDGDEPQECNPEKKNKGKGKGKSGKFGGLECDRWFASEEDSTASETADMEVIALTLDESFSTTEDNMREMNEHLMAVNDNPTVQSAELFSMDQDNSGDCNIPAINVHLANSVIALRVIHAAAEGTADLVHNSCKQTAVALGFGGNGSLVCAAFDAATLVANLAYIAVDEADKVQNGNVQAALVNCVQQTSSSVAEIQTAILNLQTQLKNYVEVTIHQEHEDIKSNDNKNMTTILTNDDENTTEIINVLNTPHGQRDQYPAKDKDDSNP